MTRATLILMVCLALASLATAQRGVVSPDLRVRPIAKLLALSEERAEIEDGSGSIRLLEAGDLIALTQTEDRTTRPTSSSGWIELTDGQRYSGRLAELASDDEAIGWEQRDFGILWIPLENVSRIAPNGGAPSIGDGSELRDVISLTNGDTLSGYLVSAGAEFVMEDNTGAYATAPADLVALARLANPAQARAGLYIWLTDGSVVSAAALHDLGDQRVQVELRSGETAVMPLAQVLAMTRDAERVVPLSDFEPRISLPYSRRWSPDARSDPAPNAIETPLLFAADIHVPGPMTLRWTLPPGATRFATTATIPASAFPWGDCEIIVRNGGAEAGRFRVNQDNPRAEINVPVVSRELEIEINAGAHGAVSDEVLLIAPLLSVER